jgi:hypothetical protein
MHLWTPMMQNDKKGTITIYNIASFKQHSTYKCYSYNISDNTFEDGNQQNKEADTTHGLIYR